MLLALLSAVLAIAAPQAPVAVEAAAAVPGFALGPFRGACDDDRAALWARATQPGVYTLELRDTDGVLRVTASAEATDDNDRTLHWSMAGLRGRSFRGCRAVCGNVEVWRDDGFVVAPAVRDGEPRATVAFGSCAKDFDADAMRVWSTILARRPDAFVLLGDTPYIDSVDLATKRARYGEFYAREPVAACLSGLATYCTWDDHDYLTNDAFGAVDGRDVARRVFVEYHAQHTFGTGTDGVYQSFRRGPIEVFVLDTRWFANTEPSPFEASKLTLLGSAQLEWLQRGLEASTAPFKVLACGMAWNGAWRRAKDDSWGRWDAERDGLLRWLGAQRIGGVILVGGDLHQVRLIRHPTTELCGYDVPECVASPLAEAPKMKVTRPAPGQVFEGKVASAFLSIEADVVTDPKVTLRFVDGEGHELHATTIALAELQAKAPK